MPASKKTTHQLKYGFTLLELMIVLAILVSIMAVSWPRITKRLQLIAPREAALQMKADLVEAREQAVTTGEAWVVRVERGSAKYEMGPVSSMRKEVLSASSATLPGGADPLAEIIDTAEGTNQGSTNTSPTITSPTGFGIGTEVVQVRRHELPRGMVFDNGFAHQVNDVNAVRLDPSQPQSQPSLPIGNPTIGSQVTSPMPFPPTPLQTAPLLASTPGDNWKFVVIFQPDGRATESEILLKEQATQNRIRLRIRGFTGGVTIDKLERKSAGQLLLQPEDALLESEFDRLDAGMPQSQPVVAPSTRSVR